MNGLHAILTRSAASSPRASKNTLYGEEVDGTIGAETETNVDGARTVRSDGAR